MRPLRSRHVAALLLAGLVLLPAPAAAFARDYMCQTIRRVEGGYSYRIEQGLSVSALIARPGPFVHDLGADVTGFTCFRDNPMPEPDDLEVLQAGYLFALGSLRTEARVIMLELTDGRVTYTVANGALDEGERRRLDRIVAQMQARLAPPAAQTR